VLFLQNVTGMEQFPACLVHQTSLRSTVVPAYSILCVKEAGAGTQKPEFFPGPRGKSFFSAGFRELTDTRLGKEESVAVDHMLLIGRTW
jgi:hypothetical protein